MSKGLEVNVEMGLCTKEMAKENPIKDFEILIEEYKDKWSKQMYDYFKECLSIIKKELKTSEVLKKFMSLFLDEEIKESFKEMTAKDLNEEIGKDLFTQEEYDLLKEVLL